MTGETQVPTRAVIFAYHDIGVRCLETLLELGIEISLVVTHEDSESEQIWFDSVEDVAERNGIEVIKPDDANAVTVIERVSECKPDYIFSFYYRQMLGQQLLDIPTKGAFNLHGSLLPKYRGRVPVNWAIIHGEKETGVSLHTMELKPDAGSLLAQAAVSILRNDTAYDVFQKLKCASENLLIEVVPEMLAGRVFETPLNLEDASDIHNLIRAVAPPYPGAFFDIGLHRVEVLGSYIRGERARFEQPCIYFEGENFRADCTDGMRFMITQLLIDGLKADQSLFQQTFGQRLIPDLANDA